MRQTRSWEPADDQNRNAAHRDISLDDRSYLRSEVVLAFLLIVTVAGTSFGEEQPMVFKDAYRCWHYARIMQYGLRSGKDQIRQDTPVKAYCVPKWVEENERFQD